jgi:hypothetical protein
MHPSLSDLSAELDALTLAALTLADLLATLEPSKRAAVDVAPLRACLERAAEPLELQHAVAVAALGADVEPSPALSRLRAAFDGLEAVASPNRLRPLAGLWSRGRARPALNNGAWTRAPHLP